MSSDTPSPAPNDQVAEHPPHQGRAHRPGLTVRSLRTFFLATFVLSWGTAPA